MIGKLKKGASFGGCVRYVTDKDEAKILASDGVLLGTNAEITQSFELQRQLNPRIKKPVGHIALSFKPEDKPRLTDEFMAKIALEYMQMIGITDTQFIIVRHHNTDNPHCHIVYNRINNEGKLISDRNDYRCNEQVTKALKSKYGLTYGTDKSKTNTRKLRNAERAKYEIHNAVNDALKVADSWQKFKSELEKRGVHLELVYKDKERSKVQGIRFCKDGYSFKGTQISRDYSFGKLNARFEGTENMTLTFYENRNICLVNGKKMYFAPKEGRGHEGYQKIEELFAFGSYRTELKVLKTDLEQDTLMAVDENGSRYWFSKVSEKLRTRAEEKI